MSKDNNHKVKSTKDTAEKQNPRQDILLASLKNKEIRRRLGDLSLAVKTIRKWLKNSTHGKTFSIELTHSVSQMIKGAMGRDFDSHSITANSIIHSLKGHGVDGTKLNEKSIPLRKSDMEIIPYIMIAPDYLAKGSVDAYGRESIRFFKALSNGVVVVVEKEYKNSPDDMETITMWAEKSSGARNARQNAAPAEKVQDAIPDTDIAKIHKDAEIAIKNDVNFSYDIAVEQLAKVSKDKKISNRNDDHITIVVDNMVIREPLTKIVEPKRGKQKIRKNRSKVERSINNQISTTMSKTKKQPVKQERAAQEKQDAPSVEKTAKVKLPEDSSLKYNVFLNGAADHMSKEDMDAYFKMTPKEKDEFLNKIRQNAEESKVENAVKYNVFLNGAAEHMSREDMEAYFKMTPKEKDAYLAKLDTKQSKAEKQHREPQMITVNGDKVSHAHTFRSNVNPENIFFTAKINGEDLKPQKMEAEDVKAYHDRTIGVEDLMKKYYPTKVMQKVSKEEFQAANKLSDGRTIEKFAVFKEDNEKSKDYGKYRMYALVGNQKLFKTLSHEDLNAYFDRVTTPKALVEKNFGEYLNLASAYEKYKLPEGVKLGDNAVSIRKGADGDWVISAELGEKGHTPERKITKSDLYSFFNAHTATKDQLAAKYLSNDIKDAKAEVKQSQSRGMKV